VLFRSRLAESAQQHLRQNYNVSGMISAVISLYRQTASLKTGANI
jgi:hypothetical protein